jgi:predicted nucleic acid-binding protein
MTVVDASALIEVLLGTSIGKEIAYRLLGGGETLHAPHLLDLEVTHALRRYCMVGQIPLHRAAEALAYLRDFPIERYAHEDLLSRIWELRHNFTVYDASYIALAEVLNATLLTRDTAFTAPSKHRARIELV